MIGPLYIIFFVTELGAADSWVGLYTTVIHVGIVVGYWLWRRITQQMGDFPALLFALPLAASYPFLVAFLPNLSIILVVGLIAHLFVPGVDLNHSLIFMRSIPPNRRHIGIAFYSMVMNLGAFVGPIVGVALAGQFGIRNTLLVGGLMRAAGVLMFYRFPMDERRLTWQGMRQGIGTLFPWPSRR
jgi:predicted MFS family arabinose efflux permease